MDDCTSKLGQEVNRDDLIAIAFEDLAKGPLAPGHIYYVPLKGKPKLLLRAGESVFGSLVEVYAKRGKTDFFQLPFGNQEFQNFCFELIQDFRSRSSEEEKIKAQKQFSLRLSEIFITGEKKGSLLDLIHLYNRCFLNQDQIIAKELREGSLVIYHRSFRVAAFATSMAILFGYYDFDFLKEFYNCNLYLDYGLFTETFSYNILEALNKELKQGGEGVLYLEQSGGSENDLQRLRNHPQIAYEQLKNILGDEMKFPELLKIVLRHHENFNGTGFPKGIKIEEIFEIESLVNLADHLFSFSDFSFSEDDGVRLFQVLIQRFHRYVPEHLTACQRVIEKCLLFFPEEMKETGS